MFGTDASLAVDVFLLTLVLTVPAMIVAIALVRRGWRRTHAALMMACFALFVMSVVAFEIDVHFGPNRIEPATVPLTIHLCFAIPCLLVWIRQIAARKQSETDPARHRRRGRLLMAIMLATVVTGVWLYTATFS